MSPTSTSSPAPPLSTLASSLPVILSLPAPVLAFSKALTADKVMLRVELIDCASIFDRSTSRSPVLVEKSKKSVPPSDSSRKKLPVWLPTKR